MLSLLDVGISILGRLAKRASGGISIPHVAATAPTHRRHVNVSNTAALSQRSDMVVFLNGEFIPADQGRVGLMTHALSYGTGCFEGLRGYWNENARRHIFSVRASTMSVCIAHAAS